MAAEDLNNLCQVLQWRRRAFIAPGYRLRSSSSKQGRSFPIRGQAEAVASRAETFRDRPDKSSVPLAPGNLKYLAGPLPDTRVVRLQPPQTLLLIISIIF